MSLNSEIAQLILEKGRAQAQGALGAGQAWGSAIGQIGQNVGQTIAAAPQQRQQQALQAAQLAAAQAPAQDRADLDAAMTTPSGPTQSGVPMPAPTRQQIIDSLPGHLKSVVSKQFADADESAANVQKSQLAAEEATTKYVGDLADTVQSHNFSPSAASLALQHAQDTFKNNPSLLSQVGQLQKAIQANPTPEGVQAAIGPILQQRQQVEVDKARGAKYAPGEVSPVLGQTPPAGPKLTTVAPGSTVIDDTTKQPVFTAPEKPATLEEQYLKAVASGDKDSAAAIAKTWQDKAIASRDPAATAQLAALRSLTAQAAQARLDDMTPSSDKNQQKFEQEYRTVLQRGLSSRSGGLGLEDAKVQQANHLKALLDQNFDPKTGEWNIPRVQLNELALGLARLTSPGGQAGEGMLKEFQQRTAKGDLAGALTYLTGDPIPANTQAITKYLADSIDRQGQTAMTNREGEMQYLRGLAPTDLSEDRRTQLEANSLNPLRQSRVAVDANGNKRLFVSTDGGKTWK